MTHTVVLTAAVIPKSAGPIRVSDPDVRLDEYVHSFGAWARIADQYGLDLVAIESSGYGAEKLSTALGPRGTVFVDESAAAASHEGKGVGEGRLLDAATEKLQKLNENDLVTKCTGRLFVRNFARAVDLVTPGVQAALRSDLKCSDSRLFTVTARSLRRDFRAMGDDVNEECGIWYEHVLRDRMLASLARGEHWVGWRTLPRFEGRSGSTGAIYSRTVVDRALRAAHSLARRPLRRRPLTL